MEKKQTKQPEADPERKATDGMTEELTEEQLDQVAGGKTDRLDGGFYNGGGGNGSPSGGETSWKGKAGDKVL